MGARWKNALESGCTRGPSEGQCVGGWWGQGAAQALLICQCPQLLDSESVSHAPVSFQNPPWLSQSGFWGWDDQGLLLPVGAATGHVEKDPQTRGALSRRFPSREPSAAQGLSEAEHSLSLRQTLPSHLDVPPSLAVTETQAPQDVVCVRALQLVRETVSVERVV